MQAGRLLSAGFAVLRNRISLSTHVVGRFAPGANELRGTILISLNGECAAIGGSIKSAGFRTRTRTACRARLIPRVMALMAVAAECCFSLPCAAQAPADADPSVLPAFSLPDAPSPQAPSASPTPQPNPCPATTALPAEGRDDGSVHTAVVPCTHKPLNWYRRFTNGPKGLTPRDKAWLATRNLVDPFNLITIGGEAAISVAADSHSPYGPGMPGYARYVGVSFTQDLTGEFFGTFAIPVMAHQDPHYHRMEGAPIRRRVGHAVMQIFWTESDSDKGMLNYANLAGFPIEDQFANFYVPGRRTNAPADAERFGIALATAPIGNFVNEFLPDVASHLHVQVVVIQRIINQVAGSATLNSTAGP